MVSLVLRRHYFDIDIYCFLSDPDRSSLRREAAAGWLKYRDIVSRHIPYAIIHPKKSISIHTTIQEVSRGGRLPQYCYHPSKHGFLLCSYFGLTECLKDVSLPEEDHDIDDASSVKEIDVEPPAGHLYPLKY